LTDRRGIGARTNFTASAQFDTDSASAPTRPICRNRESNPMKIGMITDSLPDADFDAMLAVAARLEMDMLEFGCGNWSTAPHLKLGPLLESEPEVEPSSAHCPMGRTGNRRP